MHHPSLAFTTQRQYIPSASTLYASVDDNSESSSSNSDNEVEANDTTEANFYNDFDDFFPSSKQQESPISQATDEQIISQLQKRQEVIQQASNDLLQKWSTGQCKSYGAFTVNEFMMEGKEMAFDWVRRMDIGSYPRVCCGSAHGSVYVADVEANKLLGMAKGVHYSRHNADSSDATHLVDGLDERLKGLLYGEYDGGGVLDVAMHGTNFVASAGREGGVKLFKYIDGSVPNVLEYVGSVPTLIRPLPGTTPTIVTSVRFNSLGQLFVGGNDGYLRMITFPNDFFGMDFEEMKSEVDNMTVTIIKEEEKVQQPPSPILSFDVCEELETVATAHANGNVCFYSVRDDDSHHALLGTWNPFTSAEGGKSHARSVAFVTNESKQWSIVAGGGNGEMWLQDIHSSVIEASGGNNNKQPTTDKPNMQLFVENSVQAIKPNHQGPVIGLASRPGGIIVSIAHDGILRITQTFPTPKALLGLGGYKVWVGSVCIDSEGKRLISDGRDDVVVVHDFSKEPEVNNDEGDLG
ncbi:WD40 repeat domain-containing protein [Skeletonema marinoi]|uniref:WD40 repeat domain-containing protein n=1 Tax=Skeletonema marinoi TaxID=267567 RepID=A0AAD8XZN6_9STRA|nr:WD40 repeat domain-containing protein [Skeletonema marinoi]